MGRSCIQITGDRLALICLSLLFFSPNLQINWTHLCCPFRLRLDTGQGSVFRRVFSRTCPSRRRRRMALTSQKRGLQARGSLVRLRSGWWQTGVRTRGTGAWQTSREEHPLPVTCLNRSLDLFCFLKGKWPTYTFDLFKHVIGPSLNIYTPRNQIFFKYHRHRLPAPELANMNSLIGLFLLWKNGNVWKRQTEEVFGGFFSPRSVRQVWTRRTLIACFSLCFPWKGTVKNNANMTRRPFFDGTERNFYPVMFQSGPFLCVCACVPAISGNKSPHGNRLDS